MRKKIVVSNLIFFLILLLAYTTTCKAQSSENIAGIPPIVLAGLQAYKEKGASEAVKTWIKGGPLDGSTSALSQSNNLHQVEDYYGQYKSFDLIRSRKISPKVMIVYMTLNYEKGPLFGSFMAYKNDNGWILTSFDFNTAIEKILPNMP